MNCVGLKLCDRKLLPDVRYHGDLLPGAEGRRGWHFLSASGTFMQASSLLASTALCLIAGGEKVSASNANKYNHACR
jgi:hypothetical protein